MIILFYETDISTVTQLHQKLWIMDSNCYINCTALEIVFIKNMEHCDLALCSPT